VYTTFTAESAAWRGGASDRLDQAGSRRFWLNTLDGTEWRWPVSRTEVRRDRGTTAFGAGYPPRKGLRSSARSIAPLVVAFGRNTSRVDSPPVDPPVADRLVRRLTATGSLYTG
jgi:hypothetical protein